MRWGQAGHRYRPSRGRDRWFEQWQIVGPEPVLDGERQQLVRAGHAGRIGRSQGSDRWSHHPR